MLLLLITCLFLILFYKSLSLKPLEPWVYEFRLLSPCLWKDSLSFFPITKSNYQKLSAGFTLIPTEKSLKNKTLYSEFENSEPSQHMSVLDLPELALECILEKLPPNGLCSMAGVCSSLRERCTSDHLWERHMRVKWGKIIGPAAHRGWTRHISSVNEPSFLERSHRSGLMDYLSRLWPLLVVSSNSYPLSEKKSSLPVDSTMSWYLAIETGKFWFPAQVYNRENGHVGFMLSCYDAELSYDSQSDTFQARYPPHGRKAVAIESGVSWDRIRAPPMDTSPHDLHTSDCLDDLRPGDHIEIQWRRNKEFPYGWWYGIIGHLESCDRNASYCRCHESESVVLEFDQYSPGSRWRCTTISRKDHREEGNEADGFYGGIRKLQNNDEISTWKRLWPTDVLE